eukprot:g4416.t1
MPTVAVDRDKLFEKLGKVYTEEEFDEFCFEFGIELDEVTSERQMKRKENQGAEAEGSDSVVYKLDIPANRYDLLCIEGLARGMLVFQGKMDPPKYRLSTPSQLTQIIVKKETAMIRPIVVGAILRNINMTEDVYNSFLDLQDKLHQNIARRRTLVAIGTHDLDTLQGPFTYEARAPENIQFQPLFEEKVFDNAKTYLDHLKVHPERKNTLGKYTGIIYDSPVYPVIYDSNGVVCSMPPIINGNHSKMSTATKNVFIECTATDKTKAMVVLNQVVCMISEHLAEPFVIEPVEIVYEADGRKEITPNLTPVDFRATLKECKTIMGIDLEPTKAVELLQKMCLEAQYEESTQSILVKAPPTRADLLHECDVVEDIAIAYGFNNIEEVIPQTNTVGKELPVNQLTDLLRFEIAQAGYTEALTLGLCSNEEAFTFLRRANDGNTAVELSNPATIEFEIVRPTLIPGLLKTLRENRSQKVSEGLKLFEISGVVKLDPSDPIGAGNHRHLSALYTGKTAGFEHIHGLVDRIFQLLDVSPPAEVVAASLRKKDQGAGMAAKESNGKSYLIRPFESETYFPGRAAEILYDDGQGGGLKVIGSMGILHPKVLENFELNYPCSIVEMTIMPFV